MMQIKEAKWFLWLMGLLVLMVACGGGREIAPKVLVNEPLVGATAVVPTETATESIEESATEPSVAEETAVNPFTFLYNAFSAFD